MRELLLIALFLSGCAAAPANGPPEIRYGQDECSRCRMIVDQPRFAAATRLGEEVRVLDDLGELFEPPGLRPGELAWVHDAESQQWIDARSAYYVRCEGLKTPMGYRFLATGSAPQAELLAARYRGRILRFEQARAEIEGESQ
ncbi:MAG: hypothetical protein AMXMBFR33_32140 [Candidatus Xenobia bacterium]